MRRAPAGPLCDDLHEREDDHPESLAAGALLGHLRAGGGQPEKKYKLEFCIDGVSGPTPSVVLFLNSPSTLLHLLIEVIGEVWTQHGGVRS